MLGPKKVAKYFQWQLTTEGLSFQRDTQRIARDAALDGIYVLRTSLKSERLDAAQLWQEDRGKPILAVINQTSA